MPTFVALLAREADNNFAFLRRRMTHNEALFEEVPSAVNRLGGAGQIGAGVGNTNLVDETLSVR